MKKPTLKEQNAALRAELAALKTTGKDSAGECNQCYEVADLLDCEPEDVLEKITTRLMRAEEGLRIAIADRRELLRRLNLTDMAWSAQGGACWADLEV